MQIVLTCPSKTLKQMPPIGFLSFIRANVLCFLQKRLKKSSPLALFQHNYRNNMQIENIRIKHEMTDIFARHIWQLMSENIL